MLELEALVTSRTRAALLTWAVHSGEERTMRELAHELGFSVPRVQAEARCLASLGLLEVQRRGGVDEVRPQKGELLQALAAVLLALESKNDREDRERSTVRGELVALGAPLLDPPTETGRPPEEILLDGLDLARSDATVLRVLPVVVMQQRLALDWNRLRDLARRRRLKAELGMLVSLTAELTGRRELLTEVEALRDRRRSRPEYFHDSPLSHRARLLAKERTPASVREWNFLMNMELKTFHNTLKHHK